MPATSRQPRRPRGHMLVRRLAPVLGTAASAGGGATRSFIYCHHHQQQQQQQQHQQQHRCRQPGWCRIGGSACCCFSTSGSGCDLSGSDDSDPYGVLGVDRGADSETIKRAFRRQAMAWHPDRIKADQQDAAVLRFQNVLAVSHRSKVSNPLT